jgi:hypothetical protein
VQGHRQIATPVLVVVAALAVLLAAGQTPAQRTAAMRVSGVARSDTAGSGVNPLSAHGFAAWADADQRFQNAARAFGSALGGCRMRLGSFHACATAAVGSMAYEEHNAAGSTAYFQQRPGPCGRALHIYGKALVRFMAQATALAEVRRGHGLARLDAQQAQLQDAQQMFQQTAVITRGLCSPG